MTPGSMFRLGPASPAPPLLCLNGGLLIDSGEEDATFVFRCQDRYSVYAALSGSAVLLFVLDERHAGLYTERIAEVNAALRLVTTRTGIWEGLTIPAPTFARLDLETGETAPLAAAPAPGLALNQLSPTVVRMLAGVEPAWDSAEAARQGRLALRFHDKAEYVALMSGAPQPAPMPHVPTAVLDPEVLLGAASWDEVAALAGPGVLDGATAAHVKSNLDSGGNVAAVADRAGVAAAIDRLTTEYRLGALADPDSRAAQLRVVLAKVRANWLLGPLGLDDDLVARSVRRRAEVRAGQRLRLLVQPRVVPPADDAGRWASIGASYAVRPGGGVDLVAVAGQAFIDPERRKHVGAHLSDRMTEQFLGSDAAAGFVSLCRRFAGAGYLGPISFDACLDAAGSYQAVYDCNPRLTAVFPALAVRDALVADGLAAQRLVNIDYRGLYTYADPAGQLDRLDAAGLLYTRQHQRGAVVLPNLARRHGYDVHLVNLEPTEVADALASGLLGPAHDVDKGQIGALHG